MIKFKAGDKVVYKHTNPNGKDEFHLRLVDVWSEHYFARKPKFFFTGRITKIISLKEGKTLSINYLIQDNIELINFVIDPNEIFKEIL